MWKTFETMITPILETTGKHVPNLLAALGILLVGVLAAWILSLVVRGALRRLKLNQRIGTMLGDAKKDDAHNWERSLGRVVYLVGLVFVLIAFFQTLKLTIITQPLNRFLGQIAEYAPRLLGAVALLVVAWFVAFVLKRLVASSFRLLEPEGKLATRLNLSVENATTLGKAVSEATYWVVLLLFLPAVLSSLAIEGLLGPLQNLTDTIVGFLPNLLASAAILFGGWIIARIVRGIAVGVSASLGLDSLGKRIGIDKVGTQNLSALLGTIVYVLILIPVIVASLNALKLEAVTAPASNMLNSMLSALPALLSASLILGIALVVARVVAGFAANVLAGVGFNSLLVRLGIGEEPKEGEKTLSEYAGILVVLGIMLFATMEAAQQLGFADVAALLMQFTLFAGKVVLALAIFAIGLFLGKLAATAVISSGTTHAAILAQVTRFSIVVLSITVGLQHMGVGEDIIVLAFGLLLGSVAIAGAIAFGVGGRQVAGERLKRWLDALDASKD